MGLSLRQWGIDRFRHGVSFFGVVAGLPPAAFRAAVVGCRDGKQVRPTTTPEKGHNVMGRFRELYLPVLDREFTENA